MFYNIHHDFPAISESNEIRRKALTIKSLAVIEYFSCTQFYCAAHYSEENRLLVNLSGSVNITHGKSEYTVGKNQMAFLKNNTLIEYRTNESQKQQQTDFVIFTMGYEVIKEFFSTTQLSPVTNTFTNEIVITDLQPFLLKFANSITSYLEDEQLVEETLVKIKLLELLYTLKNSERGILNLLLDSRKEIRPDITVIVEDNYMNPLSIDQLARMAGRSLSSFRRDFLSVYNMPPSQWIRERRLRKSKEFLLNTNMTVTDICYTLGFENITHFSRLFKSQFGHSPTAYRLKPISA